MTVLYVRPWEGPPPERGGKVGTFRASVEATADMIADEAGRLGAHQVVVEAAFAPDEIRRDGLPWKRATPRHRGVRVSFDSRLGPMTYAALTYNAWEDNFRSVALTLEALRAVARYGVATSDEQYTGWLALPPGGDAAAAAVAVLVEHAGPGTDPGDLRDLYKRAARRTHPDTGGDTVAFKAIQAARDSLEALGEWPKPDRSRGDD